MRILTSLCFVLLCDTFSLTGHMDVVLVLLSTLFTDRPSVKCASAAPLLQLAKTQLVYALTRGVISACYPFNAGLDMQQATL